MSEGTDPRPDGRLAKADAGARLDRAIREDLERMRAGDALARQEASSSLARAMDEAVRPPLDVAEISSVLDRLESPVLAELRGMLGGPAACGLQVGGNLLAELLGEGVEGQAILKRGLTFLKHRRYAEAAEWWSLNRGGLDASASRLHLLLLIMEAMTHSWAGDPERAEAVAEKVRAHERYRRP